MNRSIVALLTASIATGAFADQLTRVATVPLGAEVTGLSQQGDDLFFNVQHPSDALPSEFARATVGVIANADFTAGESPVPTDDAAKQSVVSSLGKYQVLFQEGSFGRKIGAISGAGGLVKVSNDPDFNAYVPLDAHSGYLFTNWEDRPGGMSRVRIVRDADGSWSADAGSAMMLDFSSVHGTWVNCFGTLSPWNTPLTSEELYFDDTADWNDPGYKYISGVTALESYLGHYPNPYDYGYIVEIQDPTGAARPVKQLALGRYSHENAVVMPDRKTVYLSDDGTAVVFFKFVADTAGDLSAGTLYAAKITQLGDPGASAADTSLLISWIELAHGRAEEIQGWIRQFDGITQADHEAGATSYISDDEVKAWAAGDAADNRVAFLESRKAAVAKGATGEFRKMEGVNINPRGAADRSVPYLYMAMSEVGKTMSDDKGDIRLAANECGVVYRMKLDANFNVAKMLPVVAGGEYDKGNAPNACPLDRVANPDNILVLANGDVVIGEDTGAHENNAIWIWRP